MVFSRMNNAAKLTALTGSIMVDTKLIVDRETSLPTEMLLAFDEVEPTDGYSAPMASSVISVGGLDIATVGGSFWRRVRES